MRLIDADQMAVDESEAYMSAQVQITDDLKWLINFAAHSKIQMLIADTPTVDAVSVIRCKDCGYWQDNNGGYPNEECRWREDETPDADDFCSYGKRKDGDSNDS